MNIRGALIMEPFRSGMQQRESGKKKSSALDLGLEASASSMFTLIEARMNRIANPSPNRPDRNIVQRLAASSRLEPIIVDANTENKGHVKSVGFAPRAVVIQGGDIFAAASLKGQSKILAWVGSEVLDYVHADHMLSSDELTAKIQLLLSEKYPHKGNINAVPSGVWVEKVWPFEGYFVYNLREKKYKDGFVMTGPYDVALSGNPVEVVQDYVEKTPYPSGTLGNLIASMCACGDVKGTCGCGMKAEKKPLKKEEVKTCMKADCMKFKTGNRVLTLKSYVARFKGMEGAKRSRIKAVAPPGFEETVKHMKQHPEIDNPYALAWSMYDEGATPHVEEDDDKK